MTITSITERSSGHVLFHGRPEWLTADVLQRLVDESEELRSGANQVERQAHTPAGPVGREFAAGADLTGLVEAHVGRVRPSGNANYLYYDQPGSGIDPHIDSPDFPLQVLIMLSQSGYGDRRSTLVVFPDGPKNPVPVPLDPGELTLFKAASVFHGRTNVGAAERAVLLGIGYVTAT